MKLKVITPDRVVFESDDVEAVYVQSVAGEYGILAKHVPMVTSLANGVLRYIKNGKKVPVAVMGGILETDGKTVSVLSNAAELADQVDTLRAEEARKRAEARLKQHGSDVDASRAQASLSRAMARLKAKQYL